ncbi:MAG: extracellular solute-binding protein, partial [Candidatus Magasanikbacteria bacterium]|nr:extracellular solute-binding protein [Candidatus Magasanikbacteria bacterium]
KDLLNAAGIPNPPETWTQFQDQAKKLVKLDPQGNIVQAAVGLGTAYNVERGVDVLQALMIQNGAQMADDNGSPTFQRIPANLNREFPPSYQALEFYTDFANPAKETFTWDSRQPNSLDAFIAGKTAFFFGYSFDVPLINARAPKLNLGMSKLPQIEGNPTKNFANYWYWTVSKKTKNLDIAWNLLNFMAKPEESKKFLDLAKRPAARKSQLTAQLDDDTIGVFAAQVLTATSWYRGKDPKAVEEAFLTMINDVQTGVQQIDKAVNFAAEKVSQTMN